MLASSGVAYLYLLCGCFSLLSLSRVIHALSLPPKKRPKHIGYRDSKLTRIMQPHLSGNACLAVLCCISPARIHLEESRSTLKFAASAKRIEVHPSVNEVMDETSMILALKKELMETKADLQRLQERMRSKSQGPVGNEGQRPEPVMQQQELISGDPSQMLQAVEGTLAATIAENDTFEDNKVNASLVKGICKEVVDGLLNQQGVATRERADGGDLPPLNEVLSTSDSSFGSKYPEGEVPPPPKDVTTSSRQSGGVEDSDVLFSNQRQLVEGNSYRGVVVVTCTGAFENEPTDLSIEEDTVGELKVIDEFITQSQPLEGKYKLPFDEIEVLSDCPTSYSKDTVTRLEDAEERVVFLSNKLEATYDVVETIHKVLQGIQKQNLALETRNMEMEFRLSELADNEDLRSEDFDVLLQQCMMLKYAILVGVFYYMCGHSEFLFFVLAVFIWWGCRFDERGGEIFEDTKLLEL
jgi:hypothetical protein